MVTNVSLQFLSNGSRNTCGERKSIVRKGLAATVTVAWGWRLNKGRFHVYYSWLAAASWNLNSLYRESVTKRRCRGSNNSVTVTWTLTKLCVHHVRLFKYGRSTGLSFPFTSNQLVGMVLWARHQYFNYTYSTRKLVQVYSRRKHCIDNFCYFWRVKKITFINCRPINLNCVGLLNFIKTFISCWSFVLVVAWG